MSTTLILIFWPRISIQVSLVPTLHIYIKAVIGLIRKIIPLPSNPSIYNSHRTTDRCESSLNIHEFPLETAMRLFVDSCVDHVRTHIRPVPCLYAGYSITRKSPCRLTDNPPRQTHTPNPSAPCPYPEIITVNPYSTPVISAVFSPLWNISGMVAKPARFLLAL